MKVRSLRYALTLAEELHFGRAAQRHYIAAQPFGRHIRDLERDLGIQLFERTSRRVRLTAAGERLLPRARRVLADLDALMTDADRERTDSDLRVGVVGFGLGDLWSTTRDLMSCHFPEIGVTYVELDWVTQYEAVRRGDVDVAIIHDVGGADDLRMESVLSTDRYAVVPATSELAEAPWLTLADLCDLPSVTPVGQPGLVDWVAGRPAPHGIEVRSPSNIPQAVATTGLIGLQAEPATRFLPHPMVSYVPVEGPLAEVAMATRAGDQRQHVTAFRSAVHASASIGPGDSEAHDPMAAALRAAW